MKQAGSGQAAARGLKMEASIMEATEGASMIVNAQAVGRLHA